jgi:hypothetical protein
MKDKGCTEKMNALFKMTAGFCDTYLDEEFERLCENLIRKMARKRNVPFLYGRIEIWAAAVVYALSTLNLLFDKRFEPCITPDDICSYFGTNKSTTYQKSKNIFDMVNMKYMDAEFSTRFIMENNPRSHLMIWEELASFLKRVITSSEMVVHEKGKSEEEVQQVNGNSNDQECKITHKQLKLSDFTE